MSLAALILKNLWSKKARSIGIAFAIGIAVMTVVTLRWSAAASRHRPRRS